MLQHAKRLAKHLLLVGYEIDHAVRDHDVRGVIGNRQVFEFAEAEFDIRRSETGGVIARLFEHLMSHVDADHSTGFTHLSGRKETVETGAAAEIHHDLSRPHRGYRL